MLHIENGSNNVSVRIENQRKLTKLLYLQSRLTKQEIGAELRLSLPTITSLVQQLESDGLITKQSSELSSGGRIPSLICFKYDARFVVGVEITHNHNRILLMDLKCNILDQLYLRVTFESTSRYMEEVNQRVMDLIIKNHIPTDLVIGVGIAIPAPVRHSDKMLELQPTVGIQNFFYDQLEEIFQFPALLENEANAAGFAEAWMHDDITNAAFISVKTRGVGGAIIFQQELFHGMHFRAGEFGHMTLIPGGTLCSCGKMGCFEAHCSTHVLAQHCNNDLDQFFQLRQTSPSLQKVWNSYLCHLSIGISSIAIALDMPIILGGDLAAYIEPEFSRLQNIVEELIPYDNEFPVLTLGRFHKNAAAIGCSLMLIAQYLGMI